MRVNGPVTTTGNQYSTTENRQPIENHMNLVATVSSIDATCRRVSIVNHIFELHCFAL